MIDLKDEQAESHVVETPSAALGGGGEMEWRRDLVADSLAGAMRRTDALCSCGIPCRIRFESSRVIWKSKGDPPRLFASAEDECARRLEGWAA